MESSYVFKYYGGPGPNEGTRIVMALGGLKWRPTAWNNGAPPGPGDAMKAEGSWGGPTATVTPGPGEWAESRWNIRTSAKREAEDNGELSSNLGRCPVLVVDGVHEIGQNKAIERFLARRLGLYGANDIEAARIDCALEHLIDAKADPSLLLELEGYAEGKGCLVGSSLSIADALLFVAAKGSTWPHGAPNWAAAAVSRCPKLSACVAAVEAHPGMVAYLAARKEEWGW